MRKRIGAPGRNDLEWMLVVMQPNGETSVSFHEEEGEAIEEQKLTLSPRSTSFVSHITSQAEYR